MSTSNPLIPWMWDSSPNRINTNTNETKEKDDDIDEESWDEARAFKDDIGSPAGTTWPPRCYTCSFCTRDFRSAQALGGHMNVHRRDRAIIRLQKQQQELFSSSGMKRCYPYSFDSSNYSFYVDDGNEQQLPGLCTADNDGRITNTSCLLNSAMHGDYGSAVCVEDDDDKSLKGESRMSFNLFPQRERFGKREADEVPAAKYDDFQSRKGAKGPRIEEECIDLELRLGSN